MPYKVIKGKGKKPWKIINKNTGRQVGSSRTKKNALASMRARYSAERKRIR